MADGWLLPGSAPAGMERMRLPWSFRCDVLTILRTPPSMNTNQIRSHWRGFQREKKSWQGEIAWLLLEAKLPRRNRRAIAGAFLRFPRAPVARAVRDPSNYQSLLNKALGDALVISPQMPAHLRFIPDDDGPHYYFSGVEFEPELGPARTRIYLYTSQEDD
jgi:hypothetical protein